MNKDFLIELNPKEFLLYLILFIKSTQTSLIFPCCGTLRCKVSKVVGQCQTNPQGVQTHFIILLHALLLLQNTK